MLNSLCFYQSLCIDWVTTKLRQQGGRGGRGVRLWNFRGVRSGSVLWWHNVQVKVGGPVCQWCLLWPMSRKLSIVSSICNQPISSLYLPPFQLRPKDYICRDSNNECDLPEYCDGEIGQCPSDVFKKNGSPCGLSKTGISGWREL